MRAIYARQIRIGIMSKCRPMLASDPEGKYQTVDMKRLFDYQYNFIFNGTKLSRDAAARTKDWYSVRYNDDRLPGSQ